MNRNALRRAPALAALAILLPAAAAAGEGRGIEDSIVKIYTTRAAPDYFTPWRLMAPRQSSGSGAVIDGGRILTNAHVVADASYLQVQKHNDTRRHQARVSFVSHDADLALIAVDDADFFDGMEALELGELPAPLQEVSVYGYPMGGKTLSITRGVLSRVEHQIYAHAGTYLLAGQIDAAINPGNSGGPVVVDGRIAGVVMQANSGGRAENLGYFVPPSVIRHVLADSEDGALDGFPDLGFRTQTLDSPTAKAAYGLERDQQGVLVVKVFEGSPASALLRENDVVLRVDGHDIADDGTIRLSDDLLTDYKYALDIRHIGERVRIDYSRGGEARSGHLTAEPPRENYSLVRRERFDVMPEYYVYGGILFVPLSMNLIKRWGNDWSRSAPVGLLQARNEWITPERRELVVALQVLAADVNLGYHDWRNWVVDYVNGEPVRDFAHFSSLLERNRRRNVVFENENGYRMVIDHEAALAAEADILSRYRIPSARSDAPAGGRAGGGA